MRIMVIYISIINLFGFLIMGIDKYKAKHHAWRIPEKFFFLVGLFGGTLGIWIGMYMFRHKTKHWYFVVGIPVLFFIQVLAYIWWK